MKLMPDEIELRASWVLDTSMKNDEVGERIENLISNYLIEVSEDESGWEKLYQDPEDKRYWELTYPESEAHGGGAPLLRNLLEPEAKKKYQFK